MIFAVAAIFAPVLAPHDPLLGGCFDKIKEIRRRHIL